MVAKALMKLDRNQIENLLESFYFSKLAWQGL